MFVDAYLTEKVVPIWPDGWMNLGDLQRECNKSANKKPKENKKPSENANATSALVPRTSVSGSSVKDVKPTSTLASTNNNVVKSKSPSLIKDTISSEISVEKSANKVSITKTEKKLTDITSKVIGGVAKVSSTYAGSMTITTTAGTSPTPKILPSVQNQVI